MDEKNDDSTRASVTVEEDTVVRRSISTEQAGDRVAKQAMAEQRNDGQRNDSTVTLTEDAMAQYLRYLARSITVAMVTRQCHSVIE